MLAVAAACSRPDPGTQAIPEATVTLVHTFERASPAPEPGASGVASIANETRPVLRGHPRALRESGDGVAEVVIRTDAVEVPPGAYLDVGFGILAEAESRGPVEFAVEGCTPDACEVELRDVVDPASDSGWRDRRLHLDPSGGERRSLRLTARSRGAPSLPVWSFPRLYAPAARAAGRRSVILISLDTLRADHLSAYGYARPTSPRMRAKLAAEGVVFDDVVAAATTTGPSHMTILTSQQLFVHGLGTGPRPRLPVPTLAQILRAHGFRTGAFTEDAALNSLRGFAAGFDEFYEDKGGVGTQPKGQIAQTFARGLAWWRQNRDKPFFLFLHTYQTHAPYHPPKGYARLAKGPDRAAPSVRWLSAQMELYDGEIRYVDDELVGLLGTLEREGLENTVVVVTSDYGEEFGEHGFWGHGVTLHGEVVRVPLFFWGAGIPPGVRVHESVGHVDLMPTALELAGVPVPDDLMGRSLVPLWVGGDEALRSRPRFTETWQGSGVNAEGKRVRVAAPAFAVQQGDRRLVRDGGPSPADYRYRYYDLATDPGEQRDRYDPEDESVAALKRLLDDYPRVMAVRRAALEARFGSAGSDEAPALDAEQIRKLRALGYLVEYRQPR